MKILIVAATELELGNLKELPEEKCDFLITGAGAPSSILQLTKHFCSFREYALAINIGIAGSYSKALALGEVVQVTDECFSDLGIESEDGFTPFDQFGFCPDQIKKLNSSTLFPCLSLKTAHGKTFNTVHGNAKTIEKLGITSGVETMEGAAVKLVCNDFCVQHIQIRAISNYVEKRDKSNWEIDVALRNLHETVEMLIQSIKR